MIPQTNVLRLFAERRKKESFSHVLLNGYGIKLKIFSSLDEKFCYITNKFGELFILDIATGELLYYKSKLINAEYRKSLRRIALTFGYSLKRERWI